MQLEKSAGAGIFTLKLDTELETKWKFVEGFIAELKELVPKHAREYDPSTHVWTIHVGYYQDVFVLHRKHFVPQNQTSLFERMDDQ